MRSEGKVRFMVGGSARSGTTLVQRIACEIAGVVIPPETHFFSQFASGMLRRRTFPLEKPELQAELDTFSSMESSAALCIDVPSVLESLGGRCERPMDLFEAVVGSAAGPARILGEKTPDHLLWWRPISVAAPWMRFVAVVRDPRAVVASTLDMPWVDDPRVPAWGEALHLAFAERWRVFQRELKALTQRLGASRILVLRYEDVVSDPADARSTIASFLGVGEPTVLQSPSEQIAARSEPWKLAALGPVTTDRVSSWHESLGERRATEVAVLCRAPMAHFGYEAPGLSRSAKTVVRLGARSWARVLSYRRAQSGYLRAIAGRHL